MPCRTICGELVDTNFACRTRAPAMLCFAPLLGYARYRSTVNSNKNRTARGAASCVGTWCPHTAHTEQEPIFAGHPIKSVGIFWLRCVRSDICSRHHRDSLRCGGEIWARAAEFASARGHPHICSSNQTWGQWFSESFQRVFGVFFQVAVRYDYLLTLHL